MRKRRHWTSRLYAYSARCPAKEGITGVHYIMDDELVTMAHSFVYALHAKRVTRLVARQFLLHCIGNQISSG